jgi:hypothetical protein
VDEKDEDEEASNKEVRPAKHCLQKAQKKNTPKSSELVPSDLNFNTDN